MTSFSTEDLRAALPEPSGDGKSSTKTLEVDGGLKIAYLGPPGTYGSQAAHLFAQHFDQPAELVPCSTITVREAVDCVLSALQQPVESSFERYKRGGAIVATGPLIRCDLALSIQHCMVVKRGVKLEDVKWVRSHEQALGQCSDYIQKHLPNATTQQSTSTAAAALSLLNPPDEDILEGEGAAICSKVVVAEHEELEIIAEGIQNVSNNYTRFVLLDRGRTTSLSNLKPDIPTNPSTSGFWALSSPRLLNYISRRTNIKCIIGRPKPANTNEKPADGLWPMWYLIECALTLDRKSLHDLDMYGENGDHIVFLGDLQLQRVMG